MKIFDFFRRAKPPAAEAKERLQVLLAHERAGTGQPEYLARLHRDILKVVGRYVEIDEDRITVRFENQGTIARLELDIELPSTRAAWRTAAQRAEGRRRPKRGAAIARQGVAVAGRGAS